MSRAHEFAEGPRAPAAGGPGHSSRCWPSPQVVQRAGPARAPDARQPGQRSRCRPGLGPVAGQVSSPSAGRAWPSPSRPGRARSYAAGWTGPVLQLRAGSVPLRSGPDRALSARSPATGRPGRQATSGPGRARKSVGGRDKSPHPLRGGPRRLASFWAAGWRREAHGAGPGPVR
ncbi:synapsin-1-like [Ananas comosus]|uniref:Synapsin-1-like n=1 Tax=Ananas comosus TaxID=4615 RepID=A0A6P5G4Z3_ANACO|nr:synapsin-1-like [Ananas comosus]